jgi:hypothetical protein
MSDGAATTSAAVSRDVVDDNDNVREPRQLRVAAFKLALECLVVGKDWCPAERRCRGDGRQQQRDEHDQARGSKLETHARL